MQKRGVLVRKRNPDAHRRLQIVCVLWCAISISAFGQGLLKPGPVGRPLLVMDDAGNWSTPISLYSDSDVEIFVPDITTTGWIAWHAREFREAGTYSVYVFSFYKNDRLCRQSRIPAEHDTDPKWLEACAALRYQRKLTSIDTRKKTVTLLEVVLMEGDGQFRPQSQHRMYSTFPLVEASPKQAYDRLLAIVDREISEYRGMTAEEAMAINSKIQLEQMRKAYTPDGDYGCPGRTSEQMLNWHETGCPPIGQTCAH